MKCIASSLFAPLSLVETDTLRAFATGEVPEPKTPAERVKHATATQGLTKRGFLLKTKLWKRDALLVTPEGLAALLDTVPIQNITN